MGEELLQAWTSTVEPSTAGLLGAGDRQPRNRQCVRARVIFNGAAFGSVAYWPWARILLSSSLNFILSVLVQRRKLAMSPSIIIVG